MEIESLPLIEGVLAISLFAAVAAGMLTLKWSPRTAGRLGFLGLGLAALTPVALGGLIAVGWGSPAPFLFDAVQNVSAFIDPWTDRVSDLHSRTGSDWSLGLWVLIIYGVGVVWGLCRQIAKTLLLYVWAKQATPVESGVWLQTLGELAEEPQPRLLQHPACPGPMTWGWRKPIILLDSHTLQDEGAAAAVLGHELAHVRSRDWSNLVLAQGLGCLLWFSPPIQVIARKIAIAREHLADAAVAAEIGSETYAQQLLKSAKARMFHLSAIGMAGRRSELGLRITRLIQPPRSLGKMFEIGAVTGLVLAWSVLVVMSAPPPPGDFLTTGLSPLAAAPQPVGTEPLP